MIRTHVEDLVADIQNRKMNFPDSFNTRELTHLRDSQKYILWKKNRFIERYAEIKIGQYWALVFNKTVSWKDGIQNLLFICMW